MGDPKVEGAGEKIILHTVDPEPGVRPSGVEGVDPHLKEEPGATGDHGVSSHEGVYRLHENTNLRGSGVHEASPPTSRWGWKKKGPEKSGGAWESLLVFFGLKTKAEAPAVEAGPSDKDQHSEFDEPTRPDGLGFGFFLDPTRILPELETTKQMNSLKGMTGRADVKDVGTIIDLGMQAMERTPRYEWNRDKVREAVMKKLGLKETDLLFVDGAREAVDRAVEIILTENAVSDVISECECSIKVNRERFKTQLKFRLKEMGLDKISSDTDKAIDSIVDVVQVAQDYGILDAKGGLSSAELSRVLTTLYLTNNPSVRIDKAELTHVPMVVRRMMEFFAHTGESDWKHKTREQMAETRKLAFLTALFHDSGKFDPNIKTNGGFAILENASFMGINLNPTGVRIDVPEGKSLREAVDDLSKDEAFLKSMMEKDPSLKDLDQARAKLKGLPLLGGFSFLLGIVVHHDAESVTKIVGELVDLKVLTREQGDQMAEGIRLHGDVSTFILDQNFGGWGIQSEVMLDPKHAKFVGYYLAIHGELQSGATPEALADPKSPEGRRVVTVEIRKRVQVHGKPEIHTETVKMTAAKAMKYLRGEFRKQPPLVQAMMLGDHGGQIDIAKYMVALTSANSGRNLGDMLYGRDRTADPKDYLVNSVLGVFDTHSMEQRALDPELGGAAQGGFDAGKDWLETKLEPSIRKSLETNETLKQDYEAWKAKQNGEDDVMDWLRQVPIKVEKDGKKTDNPVFIELRTEIEKSFYTYYADSPASGQFRVQPS